MRYGLVFDIGTTAVKAMVFDEHLTLIGCAGDEYELLTPNDGWLEVNPDTYWESMKKCMVVLREALGSILENVAYVTVTTQGETLIPVDRECRPLRNAIVWLDQRAKEESEYLRRIVSKEVFYKTTGIMDCTSAVPICKLLWIKNREPLIYRKTRYFLLLGDYILFLLTGNVCTEQSLMSTTGYYDINRGCLWREMFEKAGLEAERIPGIEMSGAEAGKILPEAARELSLSAGTIVYTSAMDQVACAVGAGNVEEGIVTDNIGTCMILAMTVSDWKKGGGKRLSVYRHAVPGKYLGLTNSMTAGIVLKWFKDEFCRKEAEEAKKEGIPVYDFLGNLAECVEPMSEGLILLPHFSGVLQPECNPDAKGVFFGVSLETKKPQFIRSIMESVGFMMKENLFFLEEALLMQAEEIRSLGGASKSRLWQQIKADILGKDLSCMREGECTALGAAMIASVSAGWFEHLDEAVAAGNFVTDRISSSEKNRKAYEDGYKFYLKLYQRLKEMF